MKNKMLSLLRGGESERLKGEEVEMSIYKSFLEIYLFSN